MYSILWKDSERERERERQKDYKRTTGRQTDRQKNLIKRQCTVSYGRIGGSLLQFVNYIRPGCHYRHLYMIFCYKIHEKNIFKNVIFIIKYIKVVKKNAVFIFHLKYEGLAILCVWIRAGYGLLKHIFMSPSLSSMKKSYNC